MTPELFGPYRVGTRLGRGGMGEVHEAFDTVRERTVALKRLLVDDQDDPDVRERFRRESRIAARLDSPHVVPIHDFGVIEDRMFIDMRLVRGRDLGSLIATEGALPAERAVRIVAQVADALDAAHEAGIVHRDVKPSNVLLATRDFGYLADFGIVHVREATNQSRLTASGSPLGTPSYMAPEQLRGEPFDQRLDVYALGCVLFEALTGRAPFVGERMAVMLSHLNDAPPPPSSLAPSVLPKLDEVVLRALAKNADDRHASAGELAADALAVLERFHSPTEARTFEAFTAPAVVPAPREQNPAGATPSTRVGSSLAAERTALPVMPMLPAPPMAPRRREARQPARAMAPSRARAPVSPRRPAPRPTDRIASRARTTAPPPPGRLGAVALVLSVLLPPVGLVLGLIGRRRGDRRGRVAVVLGATLTLAALGVVLLLVRGPKVASEDVAAQIAQQSGLAPSQVTCPDRLPAEIGASVVCTASNGTGRIQTLRATVTAVNGPRVEFSIVAQ